LNDPHESLAFILADAGYDVWLGNNRGNGYSMTNKYYTPEEEEFWDFTWDEFALIDLPTQIDFVLKITESKTLSYIGHSEGTTQAFAGFLNSTVASKVNVFIALAPAVYASHVSSLILRALALLDAAEIFELLGIYEFYLPAVIDKLLPGICTIDPSLCTFIVELLTGSDEYINETRLGYYLTYEPNPTSVKNMIHWSQQVAAGTYAMYDYGTEGNIEHYGQPTPPEYNLSTYPTDLPTILFCGGEDGLADPTDVQILLSVLAGSPIVHFEEDYGHLDPLLGYKAYSLTYPKVLSYLEQYST